MDIWTDTLDVVDVVHGLGGTARKCLDLSVAMWGVIADRWQGVRPKKECLEWRVPPLRPHPAIKDLADFQAASLCGKVSEKAFLSRTEGDKTCNYLGPLLDPRQKQQATTRLQLKRIEKAGWSGQMWTGSSFGVAFHGISQHVYSSS